MNVDQPSISIHSYPISIYSLIEQWFIFDFFLSFKRHLLFFYTDILSASLSYQTKKKTVEYPFRILYKSEIKKKYSSNANQTIPLGKVKSSLVVSFFDVCLYHYIHRFILVVYG